MISSVLRSSLPFEWPAMLGYLTARATPGVEMVTQEHGGQYLRTMQLQGCRGRLSLSSAADGVLVELSATLAPVRDALTSRLRRLLDLDADPAIIGAHLGGDPALTPLVALRPGLRVPGALDGFELALRTVLGQQVTVRGATTLAGRLAALVGEPVEMPSLGHGHVAALTRYAVTAVRLADARVDSIAGIGLPRARAQCVIALARAVAEGDLPELTGDASGDLARRTSDAAGDLTEHSVAHDALDEFRRRLLALPGIGDWTAEYVVMRALGWPDAFPDTDLVLRKAMGGLSSARLRVVAERWRPWRAYAAQHLWASAADGVGIAG